MEHKEQMDIIWNISVRNIGSMKNTEINFLNIAQEFINTAKVLYSKKEIMNFIQNMYGSTCSFMEVQ